MGKTAAIILIIAMIHWFANVGLLLLEMDTAGLMGLYSSRGHGLVAGVLKIVESPLVTLFRTTAPARESWLLPVMVINSLLWGVVIVSAFRLAFERARRSGRTKQED